MSVLWFDGFNGVATAQLAADYRNVSAGVTIGTGRDSTNGAVGAANSDLMIRDCAPTNAVRGAIGLAMSISTFPSTGRKIFTVLDATGQAIFTLALRTNGMLDVVSGGSVSNPSYITSSIALATSAWSYVEVGFILAPTNGTLVLRVNNVLHAQSSVVAFTPPLTWAAVELHPDTGMDDLYILDGAGTPNWLLTPQRVWTVFPASVGDLAEWTSSTGVGQVEDIDESPHDSDTSYIWSEDDDAVSTFVMALTPTTAPGPIHSVSLNFVAKDTGTPPGQSGPVVIRPVARSGGVTHSVPALSQGLLLTNAYVLGRYTWAINPATLVPWTRITLGEMQFGVERQDSL